MRTCLYRRAALIAAGAALAATAGCSQNNTPVVLRNLDRPSAMAFACYGGDAGGAHPIAACPKEGEEEEDGVTPPALFGFVLQGSRGTVAVVDAATSQVLDADPLTPTKNAIPIGTLPVGLTPDRSGCFMVSASAATCDLSALDVASALNLSGHARIERVPITSATGDLGARPRNVVGGRQDAPGGACAEDARPTGLVYISYPGCHMVAVVDAGTGQIQASIQFAADGTPTVGDGAVTCASECGEGSSSSDTEALGGPDVDAGPTGDDIPRPVTAFLASDGRLYIGSENNPKITSVAIDDDGLPAPETLETLELEGEVGITSLAVSDVVESGASGAGGENRFLYAVASDRTVASRASGGRDGSGADDRVRHPGRPALHP